jgi:hypothetical protein
MQFTYCPDPACGALAEIVDRFALASTDGAIDHAKVVCLHRHWFMLPVEQLAVDVETPGRTPSTGRPAR